MKLTAEKAERLSKGKSAAGFLKATGNFFYEYRFVFLAFLTPLLLMAIAFSLTSDYRDESVSIAPFGLLKNWYNDLKMSLSETFPSLGLTYLETPSDPELREGTQNMLVIDLYHQYYPFLADLQDKLQNGGSLLWTWSVGLGSNFIAMMSYYLLSPLNFFSVFVDESWLMQYLAVITVIKVGLAGAFTALGFKIMFRKNGLHLVIFSTMYALSAFTMGYYWCTIWLDAWALLPLVVAGVVCMLRDGKYKLFIFSLASAVVSNYYIGYFVCIAVVLTAIGYSVSRFVSFKKCFKDLLRSIVCTGISLLLTAPVTITSYLALKNCYKSSTGFPNRFDINIGVDSNKGVFESFHQIITNTISYLEPTSREGLPNIACGTLCLILVAVFFCCRKIKLGEKIFCANMILFLIASFIFRPLDYIWHGFHYPNQLPHRFSFIFSFLMIYMAYRAYTNMRQGDIIEVLVGGTVFGLIVYGYFLRGLPLEEGETAIKGSEFSTKALAGVIATGLVMLVILLLYVIKLAPRRVTTAILTLVVVGEMCVVAGIGVESVGNNSLNTYPTKQKTVDALIATAETQEEGNNDLWRMEFSNYQTLNDGALNGVKGVSVFSSMCNVNVTHYIEYMGLSGHPAGNRYVYYQTSPVTNLLFNVKYLIARDTANNDSLDKVYTEKIATENQVSLYENNAYVSQGFLVNPEIEDFKIKEWTNGEKGTIGNPFENQMEFWRLATGIEEPLYTRVLPTDKSDESVYNPSIYPSDTSIGYYGIKMPDSNPSTKISFEFVPEKSGPLYCYIKPTYIADNTSVHINRVAKDGSKTDVGIINPSNYHIHPMGYFDSSTTSKMTLDYSLKGAYGTSSTVLCYSLNQSVFERGLRILRESTLEITEMTDTRIEGTVNADRDGLLYTSIPYEKGWKAEVDGEKAEIVLVGDAMCAVRLSKGEHTVKFTYFPHGLGVGIVAFCVGVLALVFIGVFRSKRMKDNPVKKVVIWLFTTDETKSEDAELKDKKISAKESSAKKAKKALTDEEENSAFVETEVAKTSEDTSLEEEGVPEEDYFFEDTEKSSVEEEKDSEFTEE